MRLVSILLITIASIQIAFCAHGGHHAIGSEIRRLRKHSSRSAVGKFLKGVEQTPSYHVFIGIPSASQERRAAIRESWGKLVRESYSSEVIMRFFVHEDCGTRGPCDDAEAGFGDIIYTRDRDDELGPLAEGQEGVTQRVYLMFEHAVSNNDARFVMKADDDTFINVPALLHMLHKLSSDSNRFFYIGMRLTRDWLYGEEEKLAALAKEDIGENDGYLSTYMQGGAYILSKEAVEGIVALNHATGLRFLHYEDVAVGVWVSGMRLQFVTDQDIGYHFVGHANFWDQERLNTLKVKDNFCEDADMPFAWIHPLKQSETLLEVAHTSGACNWTRPWESAKGLGST
ncbi:hypothetical protein CVIRNUC_009966 [Coccomyxa viridis]|uniref:Hexosyltransferase n=1 Tax=Coccomyxa viridis TaxID=1274662 RepID=A0AAV1IHN1_9CHLO|nr:hypothetical protein CVIRNUC_009966 [Coccomyxa viridis]